MENTGGSKANMVEIMVTYIGVTGIPKNNTFLIPRWTPLSINDKLLQENRYEIARIVDTMVLQVYDEYGKPTLIRKGETDTPTL